MNGSDTDDENLIYSTSDSTVQIDLDTMPCSLEYHKTLNYKQMFEYLDKQGYKGHDANSAGLHIHADRKYLGKTELMQQLTIAKILYILEKFNDQICVIARRNNSYSEFVGNGKDESSIVDLYGKYKNKGKRAALNLQHPETIEFRCFRSTLKYETFILTLEFVQDIIDYAKKSDQKEFIICTEDGVNFKLTGDNPDKKFFYVSPAPCCKDMKLNTLENILSVLEKEDKVVEIDEATRLAALVPLNRMLECAK